MCFPLCPRGGTSPSAPIAKVSAPPVNFCRYPKLLEHSIAPRNRTLLKPTTIWNVAHQIRESKQTPTDFLQSKQQKKNNPDFILYLYGKQIIKQPISRHVRLRASKLAANLCRVIQPERSKKKIFLFTFQKQLN